ncbi:MAG: hypothetical protein NZ934_00270 [Hadesarchaea archaeon]|nr:hypothetical protein [Hadesarchaea archaeon]
MWLVTTLIAASVATMLRLLGIRRYKLGMLSLMLWGATVMIFIDHVLGYLHEGGGFIQVTTEGAIRSGVMLGIAMLTPVLAIWGIAVILSKSDQKC